MSDHELALNLESLKLNEQPSNTDSMEFVLNRYKEPPPNSQVCRIHLDKPRIVTLPEMFRFAPDHSIVELQTVEWLDLTDTFLTLAFQIPRPWKESSGVSKITLQSFLKPIRVYHIEREKEEESFFHIMGGNHRTYFTRQMGNSHISAFVHRKYQCPEIFENLEWWRSHYLWKDEQSLKEGCKKLKEYWESVKVLKEEKMEDYY